MKLIIITHPEWIVSRSMPRFACLLGEGMNSRGHEVSYWTCKPSLFSSVPDPSGVLKKWLRYGDQFLVCPSALKRAVVAEHKNTLFVLSDRALGMWMPILSSRPHVVHCHDFLALRSARGEFAENRTSWSGRIYQELIQRGAARADNFISVSERTRSDLHRYLGRTPNRSEVLYNPLGPLFSPKGKPEAIAFLGAKIPDAEHGGILHVGGNQWYKNKLGVLEIYDAYCLRSRDPLPLWMVGAPPLAALIEKARAIKAPGSIRFFTDFNDDEVRAAYQLASLLLFPSLEEGFGWPIAEAFAGGCPVITTGMAPMTEVGADVAHYIARLNVGDDLGTWAKESAEMVFKVLSMTPSEKKDRRERGIAYVRKFDQSVFFDRLELIYSEILR